MRGSFNKTTGTLAKIAKDTFVYIGLQVDLLIGDPEMGPKSRTHYMRQSLSLNLENRQLDGENISLISNLCRNSSKIR